MSLLKRSVWCTILNSLKIINSNSPNPFDTIIIFNYVYYKGNKKVSIFSIFNPLLYLLIQVMFLNCWVYYLWDSSLCSFDCLVTKIYLVCILQSLHVNFQIRKRHFLYILYRFPWTDNKMAHAVTLFLLLSLAMVCYMFTLTHD